tara:strand:- start:58799 stop:60754 length:1956 start_codon:yes stop_codon:yes gene_type:complete
MGSDITITGSVYFDENKNGIYEPGEAGVSGVGLEISGEKIWTDQFGKFTVSPNKYFKKVGFVKASLLPDTLPPGSIITDTTTKIMTNTQNSFRKMNFGIFYPKKVTNIVFDLGKKNTQPPINQINISVKNNFLFLNSTKLDDLGKQSVSLGKQLTREFRINFDSNTLSLKNNMNMEIKDTNFSVDSIEVILSNNLLQQSNLNIDQVKSILTKEIDLSLTSFKNIKTNILFESVDHSYAKLNSRDKRLVNGSTCSMRNGAFLHEIKVGQDHTLLMKDITINSPIRIDCLFKSIELIPLEISERYVTFDYSMDSQKRVVTIRSEQVESEVDKKDQDHLGYPHLALRTSPFIEYSRDSKINIEVKNISVDGLFINGIPIPKTKKFENFLYEGEVGPNKLSIKSENIVYKDIEKEYEFDLFRPQRIGFSYKVGQYNQKSESTFFDINYKVPRNERYMVDFEYYPLLNWGVKLEYISDLSPVAFEKIGGGNSSAKKEERNILLVYRLWSQKKEFYSTLFKLYVGHQKKEQQLDELTFIKFPKTYSGIYMGVEIEKKHFIFQDLIAKWGIGASPPFKSASTYTLRSNLNFDYNLNFLGKLFGTKADYIYGLSHSYFRNFYLSSQVSFERDRREIQNAPRGIVKDAIYSYGIGISYRY